MHYLDSIFFEAEKILDMDPRGSLQRKVLRLRGDPEDNDKALEKEWENEGK